MALPSSVADAESGDRALLAAVAARGAPASLEDLTSGAVRELVQREGIDFATALLYDRVRRSPRHAGFMARIDRLRGAPPAATNWADVLVAVVPAAFYRQMPHAGADGRVVLETAASLGLACELVPVRSVGTLAENAAIIHDWLTRHRGKRVVVVSLCKGGADVKFALRTPGGGAAFRYVEAWVNVCGTLDGSPFASWLLATKPRFIAAWVYFKCNGHDFQFLREIVPSPDGPLAGGWRIPDSLRFISVLGFPLRRHLSNGFMRRCHRFISPHGPNDGGVLLSDACRLPGLLYPIWGADHYLRPDARAREVLAAVFHYLAEEAATPIDAARTSAPTGSGR